MSQPLPQLMLLSWRGTPNIGDMLSAMLVAMLEGVSGVHTSQFFISLETWSDANLANVAACGLESPGCSSTPWWPTSASVTTGGVGGRGRWGCQTNVPGRGGTCGAGRAEEALNKDGVQLHVSLGTDASAAGSGRGCNWQEVKVYFRLKVCVWRSLSHMPEIVRSHSHVHCTNSLAANQLAMLICTVIWKCFGR